MHRNRSICPLLDSSGSTTTSMAAPGTRKRVYEEASLLHCTDVVADTDTARITAFSSLDTIRSATQHLAAADSRLHDLITTFGAPERLLAKNSSCFRSLAKSILYQQLAGTAAAAIYSRFLAVCGVPDESHLTPAAVLSASPAALRACGLSERKASYLQDLAAHFEDGRLSDELLTSCSDKSLLPTLTAVRGVGPWTVDMFSMFHLGRPDILPVGDLGVRKGLAHICGLPHLPSPAEMEQLTAPWRPFRSLGCYYMWRIPLPPSRSATAAGAGAKGKGRNGTAVKRAQSARVKVPATSVASPLGAAVAAVADVGVNLMSPMLAAGGVGEVKVVATAVGAGNKAGVTVTAAVAAADSTEAEPKQQDFVQPATPAKQQDAGLNVVTAGPHCEGTPSAAVNQQLAGASAVAAPAGDPTGNAPAPHVGVMTRRRLKWSAQQQ